MDASDPGNLRKQGEVSHVQSCDPVVVQGDLAYVTLRGECFGESNRLEVINVSNPNTPELVTELHPSRTLRSRYRRRLLVRL